MKSPIATTMVASPQSWVDFVDQFRLRRQSIGLTSLELDPVIGVAQGLVSKWECGDKNPSGLMLHCWAQSLGCRLLLVPYRWARLEHMGRADAAIPTTREV